jgi:hypothetical protein
MIFPIFYPSDAITLPESVSFAPVMMIGLILAALCALQYSGRLLQDVLSQNVEGVMKTEAITGLTAHEKNTYQCSPERGSTCGHGRWSATLRSGRRSPIPRTEKIQRL